MQRDSTTRRGRRLPILALTITPFVAMKLRRTTGMNIRILI